MAHRLRALTDQGGLFGIHDGIRLTSRQFESQLTRFYDCSYTLGLMLFVGALAIGVLVIGHWALAIGNYRAHGFATFVDRVDGKGTARWHLFWLRTCANLGSSPFQILASVTTNVLQANCHAGPVWWPLSCVHSPTWWRKFVADNRAQPLAGMPPHASSLQAILTARQRSKRCTTHHAEIFWRWFF